jgi:hypothetical protein
MLSLELFLKIIFVVLLDVIGTKDEGSSDIAACTVCSSIMIIILFIIHG